MAVAEHAAQVGGVDLNRFGGREQLKRRTRQKISHDGLQVTVAEQSMRLK
jgi:hypothetical protein